MNPTGAPDFIPDNSPDFIPDSQADQYFSPTQQTSQKPGLSDSVMNSMSKTGMFDIPVVGGLLRGAVKPATQMAETAMQEQGKMSGPLFGLNTPEGTKTLIGANPNGPDSTMDRAASTIAPQAETALTAIGTMDAPTILKTLVNLPKYMTKKGVAGLTEKAASNATQKGQFIHWDDLMDQARKMAIKQFGDTASTREALNSVIAPRTPAGIESLPETMQQTPDQLLQLRRNLVNSYGKSLFEPATQGGAGQLERKIASVVRGTVSENLHRIAPESITPDKLYSMYSKGGIFGGDVPALLLKYLGVPLAAGLVGKPVAKAIVGQATK